MKTLVIIDSNALIHRAFHALPPLKTKKGELVNAVYGFVSILFRVIRELKPDYLVATFDLSGPTFRDLKYREYKAKRIKPPQELYDQIPKIKEIVKALNIPIYEKKGFEADDLIGTVVSKVSALAGSIAGPQKPKVKSIIITGDLDTLQLVNKQTEVYTLKKGIKDTIIYNQETVKKRYGLIPKQVTDLKGLKGDPSDNIPGVPGIGEKTAIELIKKFGNLRKLYQNLAKSDINPKLKARLLEYKEQAFFSQDLATIKKDVLIDFNLEKCQWNKFNQKKVISLLKKLEFHSLIERLSMLQ